MGINMRTTILNPKFLQPNLQFEFLPKLLGDDHFNVKSSCFKILFPNVFKTTFSLINIPQTVHLRLS